MRESRVVTLDEPALAKDMIVELLFPSHVVVRFDNLTPYQTDLDRIASMVPIHIRSSCRRTVRCRNTISLTLSAALETTASSIHCKTSWPELR